MRRAFASPGYRRACSRASLAVAFSAIAIRNYSRASSLSNLAAAADISLSSRAAAGPDRQLQ